MEQKGKIKIVIVINDFLIGGAQKLILDQLKYINYEKFEITIITLYEFSHRKDFYDELPKHIVLYRLNFHSLWDLRKWIKLTRVLKHEKPNIVVSHLFDSNFVVRILKVLFVYKIIIVEHNTYINKKKWQIFADRMLSFVTETIIAVSKMVKDFTVIQEKIDSKKFRVIHNGIDLESVNNFKSFFSKKDLRDKLKFGDDLVFLSVGRLTDQKNHKLLIEGFSMFKKNGIKAKLIILGEGLLEKKLKLEVERLGSEESILILGNKQNIFDYYRSSDFLISTSKIEGLSIAYLEALAFGLPIITTRTGGTDELIMESKNGFFIEDSDPFSVKDVIEKALRYDYFQLSQSACKSAKKYDIRELVEKYENLYIEICSIKG